MDLLSLAQCLKRTGLSRTTFWRLRQRGEFPPAVRLSGCPRHVAWISSDVDKWLEQRGIACRSHRDP